MSLLGSRRCSPSAEDMHCPASLEEAAEAPSESRVG